MNYTPIIKHYQKRPVIIEAARFPSTPAESVAATVAVTEWLTGNGYPWLIGDALRPETLRYSRDEDDNEIPERGIYIDPADGFLMIRTLEGDMKVTPGDYIISGVAGEVYPCKPGIFAKTYEEVTSEWPDPPVIVIEESPDVDLDLLPVAAIRDHDGDYIYAGHSIALVLREGRDSITAWHEYVPDDRDDEPEKIEFEH